LKASKQRLLRLTPADLNVSIKIEKPKCGKNKITITKKDIRLPPGVFVERIERKVVVLQIDRKVMKKVLVRLNTTGRLLDDYTYDVEATIPSSVRISGPESLVSHIEEVQAAPIALSKENVEDFECDLKIRVVDGVTVTPKSVTATVDIYKKFDSRGFDALPIKPFGFMPNSTRKIELGVKTAFAQVAGLKQAVELLTADDLHPFVDISGIDKPGEYTLSLQCWSSVKDVQVKEINPKTIQVIIR
jgi:YbbR domain-containing protein